MIYFNNFKKGTSPITGSSIRFTINANHAKIVITEYDSYYQIDAIYNDTSNNINYGVTSVNGTATAFFYYDLSIDKPTFTLPLYSPAITINIPVPNYSNLLVLTGLETKKNYPVALNKKFFAFPTLPQ